MCQPCLARASGVIWSCRMLPARAALTGGAVVVDAAPPAPSTLDQPRAELVPASDISGAVLHALEAGAASPTCPHKSQSCAWGQAAADAVALTPPRADQPAAGWAAAAQAAATVCGPCMWLACGACQYAECSRTPTSPAPPEQRSLFQAVSQARCMPAAAARYAAAKAAALREPRTCTQVPGLAPTRSTRKTPVTAAAQCARSARGGRGRRRAPGLAAHQRRHRAKRCVDTDLRDSACAGVRARRTRR